MEKNCSNNINITTSGILRIEAQISIVVYFTILNFLVIVGNVILWLYIRKRKSESILFIRMVIIGTFPAALTGKFLFKSKKFAYFVTFSRFKPLVWFHFADCFLLLHFIKYNTFLWASNYTLTLGRKIILANEWERNEVVYSAC